MIIKGIDSTCPLMRVTLVTEPIESRLSQGIAILAFPLTSIFFAYCNVSYIVLHNRNPSIVLNQQRDMA